MTIEQPAARAGMTFHMPIISGKFHGTMPATTPTGSFFGPRTVTRPLRERDRNVQRPAADLGGQPRGVAYPVQGAADLKGAGDGNGFPLLEGFQLRQLFAVLLHQIGKTQQDAFTVSRGAPGPAAIDKKRAGADITARSTSAGLASAVVAIACPVAGSQTVNRFRSARRRGAVDIQAMLTV